MSLSFERLGSGSMPETADITVANRPEPANAWLGFGWPSAYTFTVPATWPSGVYVMSARGPGDPAPGRVLDFVVRAASPGSTSRILLAADVVTPNAYNNTGGKSLYDFNSSSGIRAAMVSFDRPREVIAGHSTMIRWLSANGYAVEHASLVDLHTISTLLDAYDCLIFGPHTEYWSWEMRDQVERFVRSGGNVMSLSGNTCYRQVRFENATRTLVGFKNAKSDPGTDLSRQSIAFAQPPVNRPPNSMLGVGWTYGAFGGPPTAYTVHFPSHWTLAGVPLGPASSTAPFMTYETDATNFVLEPEGYPRVTGEEGTPLSTVVLASADLGSWSGKPGLATATIFARHGMVFAAGTTEWVDQMDSDAAIAQITRNVLARFRTRRPFDWELIGHANNVTAMTSLENKLYVTTSADRLWRRFPVLADIVWTDIGHANSVTSLAGDRGALFAVTSDNRLWWRAPLETDVDWTAIGTGPAGGARALCATGNVLYAVGMDGRLMCRGAARAASSWTHVASMPANTTVTAMASYNGVLFATTSTNRLLRTGFDFVQESRAWIDIHHCNSACGLAVVDGMLFAATNENRLWWIDLRHAALDNLSAEV